MSTLLLECTHWHDPPPTRIQEFEKYGRPGWFGRANASLDWARSELKVSSSGGEAGRSTDEARAFVWPLAIPTFHPCPSPLQCQLMFWADVNILLAHEHPALWRGEALPQPSLTEPPAWRTFWDQVPGGTEAFLACGYETVLVRIVLLLRRYELPLPALALSSHVASTNGWRGWQRWDFTALGSAPQPSQWMDAEVAARLACWDQVILLSANVLKSDPRGGKCGLWVPWWQLPVD